MKDHHIIMEQYEDALFELLMEEVAEQEGSAALKENERLQSSSTFEIPPEVTKKNLALINRYFMRKDMIRLGHGVRRVLNKVAMVALISVVFFTTAFAASPTFRENTLDFVMEVFFEGTSISFPQWSEYSMFNSPEFIVNWLPEGYSVAEKGASGPNAWIDYSDSEGNYIFIDCIRLSNGTITTDTEGAAVEYTKINGYTAMIVEKEIRDEVVLIDEARRLVVTVSSETVSTDILRQIAEEIIF